MNIKKLAYATFVAAAAVAFVIGSAVPSEAAKKKKAAAAPPPPAQPTCFMTAPGSVCATKGGQKFTYFNSCYAMQDQAKVSRSGDCKAAKGGGKKMSKKKKG